MAKKSTTRMSPTAKGAASRVSPQKLRFGTLKTSDMRDCLTRIETYFAELEQAVSGAERDRIESVYMDGYTQLKAATDLLSKFLDNLSPALRAIHVSAKIASRNAGEK